MLTPETLLITIAFVFGLYMAWNIGANDVANAFGTSVGSGALTFKRALILAAIFEFAGAVLVGSQVVGTVSKNIININFFIDNPALGPKAFAIGMLAALLAASIWLNLATYLGQPVSTTHAIIGAVIGFALVACGPGCVNWSKMGGISASWFVSPLCGGVMAFLIYKAIRRWVLRTAHPAERARIAVPLGLFFTLLIIGYSVLANLMPQICKNWNFNPATAYAVGIPVAVLLILLATWLMQRHINLQIKEGRVNPKEYEQVERWFTRLQIVTACYMSFAHGANDVANAIGPIAGILQAMHNQLGAKATVPLWVLALGGVGIVAGLATYGRKVMESVGKKITEVTPTRGFAAEFSTATTVLGCSMMGLPISTTFVLVGAVMGVGFARGFGSLDLRVIGKIFTSWVITIPASAILSAILFWLLFYQLNGFGWVAPVG